MQPLHVELNITRIMGRRGVGWIGAGLGRVHVLGLTDLMRLRCATPRRNAAEPRDCRGRIGRDRHRARMSSRGGLPTRDLGVAMRRYSEIPRVATAPLGMTTRRR